MFDALRHTSRHPTESKTYQTQPLAVKLVLSPYNVFPGYPLVDLSVQDPDQTSCLPEDQRTKQQDCPLTE